MHYDVPEAIPISQREAVNIHQANILCDAIPANNRELRDYSDKMHW